MVRKAFGRLTRLTTCDTGNSITSVVWFVGIISVIDDTLRRFERLATQFATEELLVGFRGKDVLPWGLVALSTDMAQFTTPSTASMALSFQVSRPTAVSAFSVQHVAISFDVAGTPTARTLGIFHAVSAYVTLHATVVAVHRGNIGGPLARLFGIALT